MGAALGSLVIISFAGSRWQQILWRKQVPLRYSPRDRISPAQPTCDARLGSLRKVPLLMCAQTGTFKQIAP
jgi:hypothetical protein